MYAFAQRSDTVVVDEPLYAHYLSTKYGDDGADSTHPDAAAVMASLPTDSRQVIDTIILGPCEKPVLFMKQMAHHLVGVERGFLRQTRNVFLIRDPREMLPSLAKVIGMPMLSDTGLKIQYHLFHALRAAGQDVPVLDAQLLLEDPSGVLSRCCERLGLQFEPNMLTWKMGGHPADGVWAPHWYQNVHRSTGFAPYRPKSEPLSPELIELREECFDYYEFLRNEAIRL